MAGISGMTTVSIVGTTSIQLGVTHERYGVNRRVLKVRCEDGSEIVVTMYARTAEQLEVAEPWLRLYEPLPGADAGLSDAEWDARPPAGAEPEDPDAFSTQIPW